MIKIYGHPHSRTTRSLWALEEAGVPYEFVPIDFMAGETHKPDYLSVNPNGRIPALVDGDLKLCESMAINLYIARKYAKSLLPTNEADEARMMQWSFWGMTEIEPHMIAILVQALFVAADKKRPEVIEQASTALVRPLKVLEAHLSNRSYLLGTSFTIADLNVASVLTLAQVINFDLGAYPNVQRWLQTCYARPAFAKAMGGH